MFRYEKRLMFPVKIRKRDLKMVNTIITQYGGPDGELAAALRYLNQRYSMPDDHGRALLTDIGTEELSHVEMVATMVHQLMAGASIEEIKEAGLGKHYGQRGFDLFPVDNFGVPFTVAYVGAVGDPVADMSENMAAEQKARAVYENLIDLSDDEDLIQPLLWLREREVLHFTMFRELYERYKNMEKT
ncbi:MAG TPA: manganese catalase family protein [Acholeplasmataceae bacterium]|jgi:spore coat protein JC|nr:manganese catalase family protein [Acholeplasmataceae bacterium]